MWGIHPYNSIPVAKGEVDWGFEPTVVQYWVGLVNGYSCYNHHGDSLPRLISSRAVGQREGGGVSRGPPWSRWGVDGKMPCWLGVARPRQLVPGGPHHHAAWPSSPRYVAVWPGGLRLLLLLSLFLQAPTTAPIGHYTLLTNDDVVSTFERGEPGGQGKAQAAHTTRHSSSCRDFKRPIGMLASIHLMKNFSLVTPEPCFTTTTNTPPSLHRHFYHREYWLPFTNTHTPPFRRDPSPSNPFPGSPPVGTLMLSRTAIICQ